jgi:hypothetical protein
MSTIFLSLETFEEDYIFYKYVKIFVNQQRIKLFCQNEALI